MGERSLEGTLLEALQLGVYNHIPGDGREFVVTDSKAMKIRAEDGRYINTVGSIRERLYLFEV